MPKLVLEKFQCVEETDEVGGDNPYFFTFVGQRSNLNTILETTQLRFWKNEVDSGDSIPVNATITSAFNLVPADTLVICCMVEQDDGRDVAGAKVVAIRESMDRLFNTYVAELIVPFNDPDFRRRMRDSLDSWIKEQIRKSSQGGHDDVLEAALVSLPISAGLFEPVTLRGHGGVYKVWYRRIDP